MGIPQVIDEGDASLSEPRGPKRPADRYEFLNQVEQIVRSEAERREAERGAGRGGRPGRGHPTAWISLAILLATVGVLAATQPDWLTPSRLPAESSDLREASLRFALVLEAERVKDFRVRHGRLPRSLAEAGVQFEGITYQPRGSDDFILTVEDGPLSLSYGPRDSAQAFLGNSFDVIKRRSKP